MLTQLLPTIYAIRVPVEAQEIQPTFMDGITFRIGESIQHLYWKDEIYYSILGCCTTTEVDFDCSGITLPYYDDDSSDTSEDIMRTLLTSKGIEPTENEKVLIIKEIKYHG